MGELLGRLARQAGAASRYEIGEEIARGGMGAILRVWDGDLRRQLAMKIVLPAGPEGEAPCEVDSRVLARFLEEAQVTGQLDHPGIVPVHELGLDAKGRVYFTMKLVRGRDLQQVFGLVFLERDGWNETRALGVLQRVCEAMAYAHRKGVIHRDLKPSNVMVGDFGEVYVMDWGLARVRGQEDAHDEELRARAETPDAGVRTQRSETREGTPQSPLLTHAGDVMGTPAYMPPEQARGEIRELSPRSDVYSVGAMLYHLLARRMPYAPAHGSWNHGMILDRVRGGPPRALADFGRAVPAELVAICEKAMARSSADRYEDMLAFADDLRAYLEHRVVRAYETGAWAEARKWVQRNRPLATASAAAIALTIGGLALNSYNQTRAAEKIAEKEHIATQKANDVLSLSAIQDLRDLEARADALWPARPENLEVIEEWIRDARLLVQGSPEDPARGIKRRPSLEEHKAKLLEIERRASPSGLSGEDRWWHAQLAELVADLEAFTDAGSGLDSEGISPRHGWGVRRRLREALAIEARSRGGPEARPRWEEAIAAIASSPRYGGLRITPQIGLLPIGEDPVSGLWEFADLETGEPPARGPDGRLAPDTGASLVLVLLPGGSFSMGAQRNPELRNADLRASEIESPVSEVELGPFFLSKYEMTQGQWLRLTGANPSAYASGMGVASDRADLEIGLDHPVENVDWGTCTLVLSRYGLELPTEAQWEYAARGGTSSPWSTGPSVDSLEGSANLADQHLRAVHDDPTIGAYAAWDDGWAVHAPAGHYAPNAFGLHDTAGNVMEWCADPPCPYSVAPAPKDGRRDCEDARRAIRGGAWDGNASFLRCANRVANAPDFASHNLGLRPARRMRSPE